MNTDEIGRALIQQVSKAVPKGGNEHEVVTYISKPLHDIWKQFCDVYIDCYCPVYGSETHTVESDEMFAVSFPRPRNH